MTKIMILLGVDRFMIENKVYFIFKRKRGKVLKSYTLRMYCSKN